MTYSRNSTIEALQEHLKSYRNRRGSKKRSSNDCSKDSPFISELTSKQRNPKIETPPEKGMNTQPCGKSSLFYLPDDIQYHVFGFLFVEDLGTLCCTSHPCRARVKETLRSIFQKTFGPYPTTMKFKNLFWLIRRLHHRNSRNLSELFFWSCAKGHIRFVQNTTSSPESVKLMKHGVNTISKVDGMTAAHIVSKHNQLHILRHLVSDTAIDINKLTKSRKHPLLIATEHNNNDIVQFLVGLNQVDLDSRDEKGRTSIYVAAASGHQDILKTLLEGEADPTVPDSHDRSPLFMACENGHDNVVFTLLEHEEIDVLMPSDSGKSPLYVASEHGHANICRMLLERGADVRQETCRAKIPLYVAAELGFADVARELVLYSQEEDLFRLTHYGTTPMYIAAKQANKTIKNLFIAFCTNQKKTKARAKQILENRDNKKDPGVADFLGEAQDLPRATTPRYMEHMERFHDYKKKRKKSVRESKQQAKKKKQGSGLQRRRSSEQQQPRMRPMSARPFSEASLKKEEQMVIRQDREELRLNLRTFSEQIKDAEKQRKSTTRPLSAVMYKQTQKSTNLKLQQQQLIERSKQIKPKKKKKKRKSVPTIVKAKPVVRPIQDEESRNDTLDDIEVVEEVNEDPDSPRISKLEWHDFLRRQQEREQAKHMKRLARIKAEREKLLEKKERTKKEREKARLRAAKTAEHAKSITSPRESIESENEEEADRQRKLLQKRNKELADRARKRRELKQKEMQFDLEQELEPKKPNKVKSKKKEPRSFRRPSPERIEATTEHPIKRKDTIPKLPEVVPKRECMESTSLEGDRSSDMFLVDDRSFDDDYKASLSQERQDLKLRMKAKAVIDIFKQKKQEMDERAEKKHEEKEKVVSIRAHIEQRKRDRKKEMQKAYGTTKKKKKKKAKKSKEKLVSGYSSWNPIFELGSALKT